MTITKEERAECRKWCNKHSNIPGSAGYKITHLLDSLEMAEARAEAAERDFNALLNSALESETGKILAERERDLLAEQLAQNHICPPSTPCPATHCLSCWLEWARQQARGGEI